MSIHWWAYRQNFKNEEGSKKRPKISTWRGRFSDMLIDGFIDYGTKCDVDMFIHLCQYLQSKGFPYELIYTGKNAQIIQFFQDALFSLSPFLAESMYINRGKKCLYKYREQFGDMYAVRKLKISPYYRNRQSMPLEYMLSVSKIHELIFNGRGFYNEPIETLKFSFNSFWKDAIYILKRRMIVKEKQFVYRIVYGQKDDYENEKMNIACSEWNINIYSEEGENYIDFINHIYHNYDLILSGDKEFLIPCFSWGGNDYKLRR